MGCLQGMRIQSVNRHSLNQGNGSRISNTAPVPLVGERSCTDQKRKLPEMPTVRGRKVPASSRVSPGRAWLVASCG